MLVPTFVAFASILATSASPLEVRQEEVDPNQAVVDAWLEDISNTTTLFIGSNFYVKAPANDLNKRDCIPGRYTTNNVDRTGTWWSAWSKVSGCNYNTKSSGSASYAYTTSQTISKTVSGSFDFGLASPEDIAKTINGNGGLNLGFSWSSSKTTGFTYTCNINAGDKASVWQQNLMGWADTAQRHCTKGCGEGTWCSDWEFGHIDYPLNGGQTNTNLGCSSGSASSCYIR
jgi:hypothetical protein